MKIIWSEQAMEAVADTAGYIFDNFGKNASQKFIRKIKKLCRILSVSINTIPVNNSDVCRTRDILLKMRP